MNVRKLCEGAILMALVFVVTRFIQIPIPLGYFNVGNSVILLGCLLASPAEGIIAASVGSALADLTSFPVYTLPTLIIKAIMPLIYYLITKKKPEDKKLNLVAVAVSTLVPLFGYTLTGMILYGGFAAGIAQFPGLFIEYIANIVIFALLMNPILKVKKRIL